MGSQVFQMVLSLSLSGTLVGILLFAVKPFVKDRFSKKWQYYIWIVLIVRLLIPITINANIINWISKNDQKEFAQKIINNMEDNKVPENSGSVSDSNFNEVDSATPDSITNNTTARKETVEERKSYITTIPKMETINQPVYPMNAKLPEKENQDSIASVPLLKYGWVIWLLGFGLVLTIKIVDYKNFQRYLISNNEEIKDERILAAMDDIMMDFGIRKNIRLYQNKLVISPMLAGVFRPFIVLPEWIDSAEEVRYILAHELMHFKRKDIWYKWLFQFTYCIHWFNPFLIFVSKEINRICELSCDEALIRRFDETERKNYGNILLLVAKNGIRYRNNVLSTTLIEDKNNLKERLMNIMNYKKLSKAALAFSVLGICIISISATAAGAKPINKVTEELFPQVIHSNLLPQIVEEELYTSDLSTVFGQQDNDFNFKNDEFGWTDKDDSLALEIYNSDKLIAKEDWIATFFTHDSYWRAGSFIKAGMMKFSGSNTLTIDYVDKPTTIELNYSFHIGSGKFKIVHIGPDNKVTTITDKTSSGIKKINLSKGRNCIKMVGYNAVVNDININIDSVEKDASLEHYASEWNELAAKYLKEIKANGSVDLEKLLAYAEFIDSKDVSNCIIELLNKNKTLTNKQWNTLLNNAEEDILGEYFTKLLREGKSIDYEAFLRIANYVDSEIVSTYLIYVFDNNIKLSDKQIKELAYNADSDALDDYINKSIKKGTVLSPDLVISIMYELDETTIGNYMVYTLEHKISISADQLKKLCYYAEEEIVGKYLSNMIKSGKTVNYADIEWLIYYADEESITDYINYVIKNNIKLTDSQWNNLIYYADEDILGEYILQLADSKAGFSFEQIKPFIYYLDEDILEQYIDKMALLKKSGLIQFVIDNAYYLDSDSIANAFQKTIESGTKVIADQIMRIEYYIDSDQLNDLLDLMVKKKMITSKQAKEVFYNYN